MGALSLLQTGLLYLQGDISLADGVHGVRGLEDVLLLGVAHGDAGQRVVLARVVVLDRVRGVWRRVGEGARGRGNEVVLQDEAVAHFGRGLWDCVHLHKHLE